MKIQHRFKRSQIVMVVETYRSHPKMSTSTVIPPGLPLTVKERIKPQSWDDDKDPWVRVKALRKDGFDLPIPEALLVPYTRIGELLYGGNKPKEYN